MRIQQWTNQINESQVDGCDEDEVHTYVVIWNQLQNAIYLHMNVSHHIQAMFL